LNNVLTGLAVPAFPAPCPTAHFSAADFFRDCPWLNVPSHRKAEILVEPLYPRLGLLGGAPENGGKVSKLAALAAARKKKEGEKAPAPAGTPDAPSPKPSHAPSQDTQAPLSLRERLAASGKSIQKPPEGSGLRRLGKSSSSSSSSSPAPREPQSEVKSPEPLPEPVELKAEPEPEPKEVAPNIRASPSTFASTIVGAAGPTTAEPSHLHSSADLLKLYGQDAEPFDFAAPSPDDVVLNAQSTAKGLAIRRKV
jgi:elongation factor 1 alpha-like protein